MDKELLDYLRKTSPEEQLILDGNKDIQKDLYTLHENFVIDSKKLLAKGRLIEVRPHTRFAHFPQHGHTYVEMVYMCSGSTTHIINQTEKIILEAGDLLLLNQYVTQEIYPASENDIAVNFIILPEFFDRPFSMIEQDNVLRDFITSTLAKGNSISDYLHFRAKDVLPVKNLVENMIWTLLNKKSGSNTIIQTTMGLLFMNLSQFTDKLNQNHPNKYDQSVVFSVLKYIESHYKDGTLSDISSELNQSTYTVSKLLKKHTGFNFKDLLQQRKLQQAAYLLSQTTLTAESIMNVIGYDNSSYFYRKFRERYGCSPKEFRSKGKVANKYPSL